jgi:hypothetical protein
VTNVEWDRAQTRKEFQQMFDARGSGADLMRQFENLGQKEAA